MKTYLALARVSSREQEREGFSLDVQIEGLKRYAKDKGGEILRLFRIAETATKSQERRVFGELLEYARANAGQIDGILFYKVDRAARNLKDFIALEELESEHGIAFISVTQTTDNTPAGRMMRRTLANMATFYTEQQSLDVREGLARRVDSGLFASRAPYGYRNRRVNGRGIIEVDPISSQNVRRIFDLYAYEYVSGEDIPQRLAEEGIIWISSKQQFSTSKIYSILSDRSYLGEVRFRGEWLPGTHEAIVDRETWSRTQSILGRKCYRAHSMVYAGNLITCGHCGLPISGEVKLKQTRSGEARYVYYRCSRYNRLGHPRVRVREEWLDLQISLRLSQLEAWFQVAASAWLESISSLHAAKESRSIDEKLKELRRQSSQTKAQQDELLNMRISGEISPGDFSLKKAELLQRTESLNGQIELCESDRLQVNQANSVGRNVFRFIRSRWHDGDFNFKRRVLELVFERITLVGKHLVTDDKMPFELFQAVL